MSKSKWTSFIRLNLFSSPYRTWRRIPHRFYKHGNVFTVCFTLYFGRHFPANIPSKISVTRLNICIRLDLIKSFRTPLSLALFTTTSFFLPFPPLETSLICILLSASRDVHFDKRMICFLSGLLWKAHHSLNHKEKHIITRTQRFYVIFKSSLYLILWYAFMNRLTV